MSPQFPQDFFSHVRVNAVSEVALSDPMHPSSQSVSSFDVFPELFLSFDHWTPVLICSA